MLTSLGFHLTTFIIPTSSATLCIAWRCTMSFGCVSARLLMPFSDGWLKGSRPYGSAGSCVGASAMISFVSSRATACRPVRVVLVAVSSIEVSQALYSLMIKNTQFPRKR